MVRGVRLPAYEQEALLMALPNKQFIGWDGAYEGNGSNARMKCLVCGYTWSAECKKLKLGSGCVNCAGLRKFTSEEQEVILNNLPNKRFMGWDGPYKNNKSFAIMKCLVCDFEWSADCNKLKQGNGCPICSGGGFNPSLKGFVYALLSTCDEKVKIGITNHLNDRLKALTRDTPFRWRLYGVAEFDDGIRARALEKSFHDRFERAKLGLVFQGYTEWLVATPELMDSISENFILHSV